MRKLRAFCSDRYFSVDYQAQEIKGYQLVRGEAGPSILPASPAVEKAEPLLRELTAFVGACRGEKTRQVDGTGGRRALATALDILRAADAEAADAGTFSAR